VYSELGSNGADFLDGPDGQGNSVSGSETRSSDEAVTSIDGSSQEFLLARVEPSLVGSRTGVIGVSVLALVNQIVGDILRRLLVSQRRIARSRLRRSSGSSRRRGHGGTRGLHVVHGDLGVASNRRRRSHGAKDEGDLSRNGVPEHIGATSVELARPSGRARVRLGDPALVHEDRSDVLGSFFVSKSWRAILSQRHQHQHTEHQQLHLGIFLK